MSKRLNPHRRLLAAQSRVLMDARMSQSATQGADMAKLQQGRVRSSGDGRLRISSSKGGKKQTIRGALTSNRPMKPVAWEGQGTLGKIVRGQLQRVSPLSKQRFAPK